MREVRIVVDVFESRSGIAERLGEFGAVVERRALRVGDYAVANALVERKTVDDLHHAILKGRFWPQVRRLRAATARPYVLIEGDDLDAGPLRRDAARGAWLALVELGVCVLHSTSSADSARWLYLLAKRGNEPPRRVHLSRPTDPAEAMLAAVPGISVVCARALLNHFGSLAEVVAAGTESWLSVPNIGPKRAAALAETLNQRSRSG